MHEFFNSYLNLTLMRLHDNHPLKYLKKASHYLLTSQKKFKILLFGRFKKQLKWTREKIMLNIQTFAFIY